MTGLDGRDWEGALDDACCAVALTDVFVGDPLRSAERYPEFAVCRRESSLR